MRRTSRTRAPPHRYVSHREVGRRPHCLDTFNALIAPGLKISFAVEVCRMWTGDGRPEWRAADFLGMEPRGGGRPGTWGPPPPPTPRGARLLELPPAPRFVPSPIFPREGP